MNEITANDKTYALPDEWELKDELLQGDLEKWEREYNRKPSKGLATDMGAIVRAAIAAKWFDDCPIKANEVARQHPQVIAQVARFINALYQELTSVPDFLS
jgi:hypothetical protein